MLAEIGKDMLSGGAGVAAVVCLYHLASGRWRRNGKSCGGQGPAERCVAHGERLAVVETAHAGLKEIVGDIKTKVDGIDDKVSTVLACVRQRGDDGGPGD